MNETGVDLSHLKKLKSAAQVNAQKRGILDSFNKADLELLQLDNIVCQVYAESEKKWKQFCYYNIFIFFLFSIYGANLSLLSQGDSKAVLLTVLAGSLFIGSVVFSFFRLRKISKLKALGRLYDQVIKEKKAAANLFNNRGDNRC